MKKDEGRTGTAVELVLAELFATEPATSIELAASLGLPVSQVSSALSRLHKRIPYVLARDAGRRPYRWRVLMETSPEEAYQMYLDKPEELPEDVPTDKAPEASVPLEGVVELTAGGPSEVNVTVTGRIEIAVGWVGKL